MEEKRLFNLTSSPHLRSEHTVTSEMLNVIIALLPATVFAVFHFGLHSLLVILMSVVSACLTEFVFDYIAKKPNTLMDGSAIVTGLLLALCLPPSVPLYIPYIGSLFAVLFAKCMFGGLGKNFMNPALAGRAFLLISFGKVMTDYSTDALSGATPLAILNEGRTVNIGDMFLGNVSGHIGVSVCLLLIGGIYLIWKGTIKWLIPVSTLGSFVILMALFGTEGFDVKYLLTELCGGGIVLGAFFMATDPVTSPMAEINQVIYGCFIGFLSMIFRTKSGMADGTSYAIIVANMVVPVLDKYIVPHPFGIGKKGQALPVPGDDTKKKGLALPTSAVLLAAITLIAGVALAGANALTVDKIAENQLAKKLESYASVIPGAEDFGYDDEVVKVIEGFEGGIYGGGSYGKTYINEAVVGKDASGNPVGYAVSVTNMEGFDGEITLSVGFDTEGTVLGIEFTVINETAGMGMLATEASWKAQFAGVKTDSFILNKGGGSTAANEIDSVSGASVTSGAVVNAVNAAVNFYQTYLAA
ncbi:MAG: RnfABCDGE type electron transport complex subunit D [Lachnospiraceae bacterium]|nr:RnfABCDGE type electron transport complex subunit D [Lachnospiraceae bacterium]